MTWRMGHYCRGRSQIQLRKCICHVDGGLALNIALFRRRKKLEEESWPHSLLNLRQIPLGERFVRRWRWRRWRSDSRDVHSTPQCLQTQSLIIRSVARFATPPFLRPHDFGPPQREVREVNDRRLQGKVVCSR